MPDGSTGWELSVSQTPSAGMVTAPKVSQRGCDTGGQSAAKTLLDKQTDQTLNIENISPNPEFKADAQPWLFESNLGHQLNSGDEPAEDLHSSPAGAVLQHDAPHPVPAASLRMSALRSQTDEQARVRWVAQCFWVFFKQILG